MVLFLNVKVNQKVLVRHKGRVIPSTVRYKGHLNLELGEWVGVELDHPCGLKHRPNVTVRFLIAFGPLALTPASLIVGKHNGTWRGWQYFACTENCGLFTHASNVKFFKSNRRSFDSYRKVCDHSESDETLFVTEKPAVKDRREPKVVDWEYVQRARNAFRDPPRTYGFGAERSYPLSHAVGNNIPAATMLNPETAMKRFQYISEPVHREYASSWSNFNPTSSIPHYTMPHQEQLERRRRYGRCDGYVLRRPRFLTV